MKKYTTLPLTLYRMQNAMRPVLRPFTPGKRQYDFKPVNGLYLPLTDTKTFKKPNGLSMRPKGMNLYELASNFDVKYIFVLEKGLVLPPNFVVFL